MLAHHWLHGDVRSKALDYLQRAGEEALRNFENKEAIDFFTQVLELDGKRESGATSEPEARRKLGNWQLRLGRAYVNDSMYVESREHFELGLSRLGMEVPKSRLRLSAGLLAQIARQTLHRLRPSHYLGSGSNRRSLLLQAADAYTGLLETYFYSGERLLTFYSAFATLNVAERAGLSPVLAYGYANVGSIVGFMRLPSLAEIYHRQAIKTANSTNDLPALVWATMLSGIHQAGRGHWVEVMELFEQLAELATRAGHRRRWYDAVGNPPTFTTYRVTLEKGSSVDCSCTPRRRTKTIRAIAWRDFAASCIP